MNRKIEVYCFICGPKELTDEQYNTQLSEADANWHCPTCPSSADWLGIQLQCPNCSEWVSDEKDICPNCVICMYCNDNGAPEQDDRQCPLCGAVAAESENK